MIAYRGPRAIRSFAPARPACEGLRALALLTLLAAAPLAAIGADGGLSALPDTLERVKRSLVGVGTVQATRRPPNLVRGTGFVVADGRHVLTNAHVLPESLASERRESLALFLPRGRERIEVRAARVVERDLDHDVALLAFDGAALPPLELGRSERVREGELYAFTGLPINLVLGLRPVTHRGIVSAITPVAIPQLSPGSLDSKMIKRLREPYDVFQLDATAYPGDSGSPLYDPASGVVIGVINKVHVKETKESVLEKPSGITYAVPITYGKALLRKAGLSAD